MKKIMIGLLFCSALMGGCKKSSTTPAYTPDCTGAVKSYSSDVSPIIQSACANCHSNFSNYAQISGDKSAIRSKIVDGSMPQGGSLSAAQKNNVVCWIDNGALNN
ncbi:MAG: hypothetical protein NT040_18180 [Bacteroidetes bacterium]|nr:hypothetical protein [Bacteroidota bacterium]